MYSRSLLIILLVVLALKVDAIDTSKHKKVTILPVPAFGYTPETSTYLGAVSLFTFDLYNDTNTRTSNAKLEFNYTWRKQMIIETAWNYFFKQEKWFTKGRLHYSKFPDRYYGIGSSTPDSNELLYSTNRVVVEAYAYKKLRSALFVGGGIHHIDYRNIKTNSFTVKYPELIPNVSTSVGLGMFRDNRDNLLNATKGSYYSLQGNHSLQQSYSKLKLDMRNYTTFRDKYTVALRLYNEFTLGVPPFYDYSFLGGDQFVRGYYYGRYRDLQLSTLQLEARSILVWRLGLAVFAGLSSVYKDLSSINLAEVKSNYGLGLRFLIDRKSNINLRVDYARGEGNSDGFYISFGESF